jgi:polygalacturonase
MLPAQPLPPLKITALPPAFWPLTLLLCLPVLAADSPAKPDALFNVRTYGAAGDNKTKDTAAFQKALDACAAAGGGEVVVPAGNYLIGSIELHANTTLRLEKDVFVIESSDINDFPLITGRFEGATVQVHRGMIYADHANHIAIVGPGGFSAASALGPLRNPRAPVGIELVSCDDVTLDGFSYQYDQPARTDIWCIHPMFCTNLTIKNLYVRSQGTNGDGLDIDSCSKVTVQNCDISSGDDAISLKSGRGMEAVREGKPTEDVIIKDCKLASVHFAAIGFGTEISGGVNNVTISNCTISGVQNAIFIKSRDGRGGYMENITCENLTVEASPTFVGIDLMSKGIQAAEPVTGDVEKWTKVGNLVFKDIKVNNVRTLVETQPSKAGDGVSDARPIDGLTLSNITGTCQRGITLTNVVNADFSNLNVTGYDGPLLTLKNVTGKGLDEPSPSPSTDNAAKPAATGP